jgi:PAP2 superfamily C-terminal
MRQEGTMLEVLVVKMRNKSTLMRDYQQSITVPMVDARTAKILWRDFLFLVLIAIAISIIGYVENHSGGVSDNTDDSDTPTGIVDTGFMLTASLHAFLEKHRDWNDILAAANSLAMAIPVTYVVYVTVWIGDYSLPFRVIAIQLLRSFCGWFTYLPPDKSYLTSYYDFPDIVQCLFTDCSGAPQAFPFVSFFSGHVATMVIAGNHMWLHGHKKWSVLVHTLDVLQIVRLLATRGHYSIDIIIGYYMAIYVSNSAGRLGRYYSRGASIYEIMPANATEAFETVTGVTDARNEARMSTLMKRKDGQELLLKIEEYESDRTDTTARIIHSRVNSYGSFESKDKDS